MALTMQPTSVLSNSVDQYKQIYKVKESENQHPHSTYPRVLFSLFLQNSSSPVPQTEDLFVAAVH